MKLLHTSDWHVGKTIRGHSRADEHRAVLGEIVSVAERENVDLVVMAGDLFETAAPNPESEAVVYEAFLALARVAPVLAVAGNHDNPRRFKAIAPLLELGRVTLLPEAVPAAHGGAQSLTTSDGTVVKVALLPFVSQRAIIRADQLMSDAAFEQAQAYSDRLLRVLGALTADFSLDAVNLVIAHAFVQGGSAGGGERAAHLQEEYAVPALAFPAPANYVALGHLHRPQAVRGATAIHYCGSPLQLDFGEEEQVKQVNVVELVPGLPARVTAVPLTSGRPLRTVRGTLEQLAPLADTLGDAWLRVRVNEPARSGLADEIRAMLGAGVVDVIVDHDRPSGGAARDARRDGRTPHQLFADYLAENDIADPALETAFARLYEQLATGERAHS